MQGYPFGIPFARRSATSDYPDSGSRRRLLTCWLVFRKMIGSIHVRRL